MQTLELKISENYIDIVLAILRSLKDGMIEEINIKKKFKLILIIPTWKSFID